MPDLYGPPAPAAKKKKAMFMPPQGPIQPAFPAQEYMGNPWSKIAAGTMPMPDEGTQQLLQMPQAPAAPAAMKSDRIASNVFEPPNIELANGIQPQLKAPYVQQMPNGGRPGDTTTSKLTSDQTDTSDIKQDLFMQPEKHHQLVTGIENTPTIQRMLAAQKAREQLGMDVLSGSPGGVDLSPLMALTDTWTGSKLAPYYKAPTSYDAHAKALLDFADKSQDDQQKLADMILKNVQYLKEGSYQDKQIAKMGEVLGIGTNTPDPNKGRGQPKDESLKAARFLNTFKNIDVVKEADKALSGANEVLGNIQNPNWLTDSAVKANILKTMQLYPVSDLDASMVEGGQSIKDQSYRLYLRLLQGGRFLPDDRKTIEGYAALQKKAKESQVEMAKKEYVNSHGPHYGFDEKTGMGLLSATTPKSFYPGKPPPDKNQAAMLRSLMKDLLK